VARSGEGKRLSLTGLKVVPTGKCAFREVIKGVQPSAFPVRFVYVFASVLPAFVMMSCKENPSCDCR